MSTILAAMSLLIALAALALWVRSYWAGDQVGWYRNRWSVGEGSFRAVGFDSDSGGIVFFLQRRESHLDLNNPDHTSFRRRNPVLSKPSWIAHDRFGYPYMTDYAGRSGFGFGYFAGASQRTDLPMLYRDCFVVMPHWFLVCIATILPARWLIRANKLRRATGDVNRMRCDVCGYDLRATPERCPECGTERNRDAVG